MTRVGIARARDLAGGRPQSLDTIQRMASFFARHAVDKKSENWGIGSRGWQAWMGWGGDAGRRWADRILAHEMKDGTTSVAKVSPLLPAPVSPPVPPPAPPSALPVTIVSIDALQNESEEHGEGDGAMARGQLLSVADKAAEMYLMLSEQTDLEPWVQSLITDATRQIGTVYDYLKYSSAPKELGMNKTLAKAETYGGVPRSELGDTDFVITEERKFPIMTAKDVRDAVASWGRYKGDMDFETFKERLTALATQKGLADALPESWKEEENTADMDKFFKFADFQKASPDQRVVVGYASSERIDGQNDIVDAEALKGALEDYMQWANLREMHQPKAVGKVLSATPISGTIQLKDGTKLVNPLRIIAKIIDEDAWQKVKAGILKGFSIGGKVKNAIVQKVNGKEVRRITDLVLNEISLVDRPANPDARIVLLKRETTLDKQGIADHVKNGGNPEDLIAKAKMADPQDILPQIQMLRNQAEIDGDLETAERYNEVITLMLEAMGIIPMGSVREIEDMEEMTDVPDDMQDMESLYSDDTGKRSNSIMYASVIADLAKIGQATNDDLLKIGRAISKNNMDTLSDIYRAAKIITILAEKMGVQNESESAPAPTVVIAETEEAQPISDEDEDRSIMEAIANAPQKMMPGNNTGAPIHTPMNPNAPAQNVTGGYPIQRSAPVEDLRKSADPAVDITQIEQEIASMEDTVETPPIPTDTETTELEVAKSVAPAVDVTAALQDVIAKSLQGALATTVAQMDTVVKAVERIESKNAEQSTAVWDALKPLTASVDSVKGVVEPLVEKVAALEAMADKVSQLANRLESLENSPVEGGVVLRGQAVTKSLGGADDVKPASEADTLRKMIDETKNPIVRTQLMEQLAYIETKQALFGVK